MMKAYGHVRRDAPLVFDELIPKSVKCYMRSSTNARYPAQLRALTRTKRAESGGR